MSLVLRRAVLAAMLALPGAASSQQATPSDTPIGTARMMADGTIVLDLLARGRGASGDARLTYPLGDPQYQAILRHLGGLQPGEIKPVRPFP